MAVAAVMDGILAVGAGTRGEGKGGEEGEDGGDDPGEHEPD